MAIKKKNLQKEEILVSPYEAGGLYSFSVDSNSHQFVVDEPQAKGGDHLGMNPFELLASSLGACTAITLRYYAQKKGLDLGFFQVKVTFHQTMNASTGQMTNTFKRTLFFADQTPQDLLEKYKEIAEKCPVHKALLDSVLIETQAHAGMPEGSDH
jgi:putative redox protein